ncbi:LysR family transcriptional regulator [Micromonospora sp. NBRC 107095]|uniref:LysR family transcriptional regulator n=1 Tax=Micromonospora sp. NBRC 107095 TaxID=3032209 RepID=UPI002554271E|nr:LysR family transcriptional regulator [Micromonospora sp. NBRC 107095]
MTSQVEPVDIRGYQVNERELQAFVAVAEHGRMDMAARALGYSQPAVSYQIKCLEMTLGTKLFVRTSAGVTLTRSGALMLPSVQAVLTLMRGIKATTADLALAG